MIEAALVFDVYGVPLLWHRPGDATGVSIPDSDTLADFLWQHRQHLGGVAHTHPWSGAASPSQEDVTTFSAVERWIGRRLIWPIATLSEVRYFGWTGPGMYVYAQSGLRRRFRLGSEDIEKLRNLSR